MAPCRGGSSGLKEALKSVPREKVTILTKIDVRTAAESKVDLERFRQELGTDYIDIVLLHGVRTPNWTEERQGAMEVLSEAREKGIIRTHGVSIHSLEALQFAGGVDLGDVPAAPVGREDAVGPRADAGHESARLEDALDRHHCLHRVDAGGQGGRQRHHRHEDPR